MKKPHIEYPRKWDYKLFGTNEGNLRKAVVEVMGANKYELALSRKSSGGKYVSLHLETEVYSEDERNKIYTSLSNHKAVIRII